MQIQITQIINKPVAAVWEVLGKQFGQMHHWASVVHHAEGRGAHIAQAVCDQRVCQVAGMGQIREKVLEFDEKNFVLKYEVQEGFPFFVKRGVNRWSLSDEGSATRVTIVADVETQGIVGAIMAPMMKMQLSRMLNQTAEELKYYVENNEIHPRKQKAIARSRPKLSPA